MDWIYGKHVLSGTDFTARIYSCHGPLTTFIIKIKTVDTLMRKGMGHTAVSTIEVLSVTLHNSTKPFITIRHKMGMDILVQVVHIYILYGEAVLYEYPQFMFWSKNKKNRYTPTYPTFTI